MVSLTDAPNDDLEKVYVNIKEVLLKVGAAGTKRAEVKIADNVGVVDLLSLQDGIMMGMADKNLPVGLKVNQIRLVLEEFGNSIEYSNGETCDLQIPSQSKTGLKIVNPEFTVEEGKSYSLVVDFDAKKSIVHQGNGGCLLKPVLRWGGIAYIPDGGDIEDDEEVIVDNGDDGSGYDDGESNDDSSGDNSSDDSSNTELADCDSVDFDLYDVDTWPSDFVFSDYEHCY